MTIVILHGNVMAASSVVIGNQGIVITLTTGRTIFVPVEDGAAIRQDVGGADVARLVINSPYWILQ